MLKWNSFVVAQNREYSRMTMLKKFIIALVASSLVACQGDSPIESWEHDDRGLYAADFGKSGELLLVATIDNSAQLWSTRHNEKLFKWSHKEKANSDILHASLSENGKIGVTADSGNIVVWDAKKGSAIGFWKMPGYITKISVTENGKYALVGYSNRTVQLIDLKNGRSVWQANHNGYIQTLSLSSDGQYAAIGDDDSYLTVWDINNSKKIFSKSLKSRPRYVKISNHNKYLLLSSSFEQIQILDLMTGEHVKYLTKYQGFWGKVGNAHYNILTAQFNRDDSMVLIGAPPRTMYLWNLNTGAIQQNWQAPKQGTWKPTASLIYAVAFSVDEKYAYCESSDGMGYKWKINQLDI
ncbi:MAG: PQQ-binding-like beta-propeller repeat protein [Francisellaceae bacterium]|jgi:WD40 repeat protein|nr:PQQ-binding-like beta-propeller repeat protein [Francisellaceae bacterium]MBT6538058.1 PQQ-binding-like beta-propeller repeat protein [Francisellaceae bacterium]